jgi:DnaJ-class molecular chaperone
MEEIHRALDILGLPVLITKNDIKKRYFQLAKRHHPDKGGDSQKMEEINWAYQLLNSYIDGFRYSFDEDEFKKRFPQRDFEDKFTPFDSDKK